MTKIEASTLALEIEHAARIAVARARGQIGACHRKTLAHLVPKFETTAETTAYEVAFDEVRQELEA